MYDNVCKFIVEEFSTDIATWLLGEPIELVELSPKELSLEPIRADSLILRQSDNVVLLENQFYLVSCQFLLLLPFGFCLLP